MNSFSSIRLVSLDQWFVQWQWNNFASLRQEKNRKSTKHSDRGSRRERETERSSRSLTFLFLHSSSFIFLFARSSSIERIDCVQIRMPYLDRERRLRRRSVVSHLGSLRSSLVTSSVRRGEGSFVLINVCHWSETRIADIDDMISENKSTFCQTNRLESLVERKKIVSDI